MKKPSTFHLSFLFFLLFFVLASSAVHGGASGRKLLNFPDMSWKPNGGGWGNPTGDYGHAHGPNSNWYDNWGSSFGPSSDWGYGPTHFKKGYGYGFGPSSVHQGWGGGGYWPRTAYSGGGNGGGCGGSGGNEYHSPSPTTTKDESKHE